MKLFREIRHDRTAATAVEYSLVAALISLAAITAMQSIGDEVGSTFNTTSSAMAGAN